MGTTPPAPIVEHARATEATPVIDFLQRAIEGIISVTGETPDRFAQRTGAPVSLTRHCRPPAAPPRGWTRLPPNNLVRFQGALVTVILQKPEGFSWYVLDADRQRTVRRGESWHLRGALREASRVLRQEGEA